MEKKKSLQVKTITKRSDLSKTILCHMTESYTVSTPIGKYHDEMLLVMLSTDRKFFALQFYGKIKVSGLKLAFLHPESKYKDIMYTDENKFTDKLHELIPESCDYELSLSKTVSKEFEMIERLKIYCVERNIPFKINETRSDTIDCYVNNKATQLKYCSCSCKPRGATFSIPTFKYAGREKNRRFSQPYNINDPFEQIIIELGGPKGENTKYHSNFCIIPKNILKDMKILKDIDNDIRGNISLSICPPFDYKNDHWSKIYWNSI